MEESLLLPKYREEQQRSSRNSSSSSSCLTWVSFFEEVKRLGCIAGPMVAVVLSQYMLRFISMMMVGHLGELALSSSSIAISLAGATGFSLFKIVPKPCWDQCCECYMYIMELLNENLRNYDAWKRTWTWGYNRQGHINAENCCMTTKEYDMRIRGNTIVSMHLSYNTTY